MDLMGISTQALLGQLTVGLINGSFYALLSLGLAIIFGLLNIGNFAHGAQYMLGALVAWMLLRYGGLGYWWALLLAPLIVGGVGTLVERMLIRPLYGSDPLYSILLTFGIAIVIQGVCRDYFGISGMPYAAPPDLTGAWNLGFMYLPIYRGWVIGASIVICIATCLVIEKTKLGAYMRAATENPTLLEAFGVNVPLLKMATYGAGTALAALAGVFAAPIYSVNPIMGADLLIVVLAVVVTGGLGSIRGSVFAGFGVGVLEGLAKVFYPPFSNMVVFAIMIAVLMIRPRPGLLARSGR